MVTSLLELTPDENLIDPEIKDHDIKAAKLYLLLTIPEIICFGYTAYFCIFKRASRPSLKQFLILLGPGMF